MSFSIKLASKMLDASDKAYKSAKARRIEDIRIRGATLEAGRMTDIARGGFRYDTEFYIAANAAGDIVVAFRGSETQFFKKSGAWRDWVLTDFDAKPQPWPRCPSWRGNAVYVHRGIWNAYDAIARDLHRAMKTYLKKKYTKGVRILVTGHSLGGALAQFAAADLGTWFKGSRVEVYTFAAPRVGDRDFGDYLHRHVKGLYQVINRGDPVPYVPPVGPNVFAKKDKKYWTPGKTIYLRGKGKVSPAPVMAAALNPLKHKASAYKKEISRVIAARDPAVQAKIKKVANDMKRTTDQATDKVKKSVAKAKSKAKKAIGSIFKRKKKRARA